MWLCIPRGRRAVERGDETERLVNAIAAKSGEGEIDSRLREDEGDEGASSDSSLRDEGGRLLTMQQVLAKMAAPYHRDSQERFTEMEATKAMEARSD